MNVTVVAHVLFAISYNSITNVVLLELSNGLFNMNLGTLAQCNK